jgi:hypothetical protein
VKGTLFFKRNGRRVGLAPMQRWQTDTNIQYQGSHPLHPIERGRTAEDMSEEEQFQLAVELSLLPHGETQPGSTATGAAAMGPIAIGPGPNANPIRESAPPARATNALPARLAPVPLGPGSNASESVPPASVPAGRVPAGRVPPASVPPGRVPPGRVPPWERVPPAHWAHVPPARVPSARVPPASLPPASLPPASVPSARIPPEVSPLVAPATDTQADTPQAQTQGNLGSCIFCFSAPITHLCRPCNHLISCLECTHQLEGKPCAICRRHVTGCERVFVP